MPLFQTDHLSVEVQSHGIAHCWIDVKNRTYNVFSRQVLDEMSGVLGRVAMESGLRALVFLGRKETGFMAGADLHEFTKIQGPADAMALSETGQKLMDQLERLPLPTLAVIRGPCLGGGLEFSLACDYRIVLDVPGTQIGLPEIELGLVPGWGGTQRLPRVVGLQKALQVILQRRRLNAGEALEWGLADAVQNSQAEAIEYIARTFIHRVEEQGKRPKQKLPVRGFRNFLLEGNPLGRTLVFRAAEKILRKKVPDDMPAPLEALAAVRTGLAHGIAAGLQREREAIGRLATTSACRNMITLFFLIERSRKAGDDKSAARTIRRVGVVGAGTMGAGIAQLAAVKGFAVVVQEVNEAALAAGMKKIEDLFDKAVERRLLSREEARKKLAEIGKTTTWEGFGAVDVVVEAAIEDVEKKRDIFHTLDQRTPPGAILATNTSSLLVRQLQEGLQHPGRVAGLHFFNPVHKMPLVEVVRAPGSDSQNVEQLRAWAAALGKIPVIVGDSPGFVVNRILMPYLGEAVLLAAQKLPVERLDQIMRRFGMPMGPFELLDQVGIDVAAHIARTMHAAFGQRLGTSRAAQGIIETFEQMCKRGWLGQKNGAGFYRYEGKKQQIHAEAAALLPADAGSASHDPVEARDRMVLLMVNEAAACLQEGLGDRADVIDLAMVLGTGWAPHRGGPLRYADDRGVGEVVKTLEDLARRHGKQFEPCAELRKRVDTREPFYSTLPAPELS